MTKITIVCGHFIPSLGYIEVHIARAFALLGHEVSVITSTAIPSYVGNLNSSFGQNPEGVEVIRLKPKFTLGQIVTSHGIHKELNRLNPDLVFVIGLGKAFPKAVFETNYPIISLFGDNTFSYANGSLKTKLLFSLFKKGTYQKAIDRSKNLIAYTPESYEAAAKMIDRHARHSWIWAGGYGERRTGRIFPGNACAPPRLQILQLHAYQ